MARRSSPPSALLGSETPRLATDPLRKLTRRTTLGHDAIRFAEEMLGVDLLPWQRWWLLHALELDRDGGFRYRTVLTLVARQNGKTHLLKALALWAMYMGKARLVLGAAQSLIIARESWQGAVEMAEADPELRDEIETIRRVNGEQELKLTNGARYQITAATRSAGRGLSVDLLILDELREHRNTEAWNALSKTTMARPSALTVCISNAGDDGSVVLNQLRAAALAGTDPTLGLFEWSAPDGCELDDWDAIAQANPGLGHTISASAIRSAQATDTPAGYRTEVLCQHVDQLDGAIDLDSWNDCADPTGTLEDHRDRIAACVDVAPDGRHATLSAAAVLPNGKVRTEIVASWSSTEAMRDELPAMLARVQPRVVAWYPGGPAAALAPILRPMGALELKGGDVSEACMGLDELVQTRRLIQPGDPLLDAHVAGATRYQEGDRWRFARRGGVGHVDAAYATAGCVHAARTLPPPKPRPLVLVGRRRAA